MFVVARLWLCVCGCVLWSRSGREHWAWMAVVEVRRRTRRRRRRSRADIKSNNPHLTGGEKKRKRTVPSKMLKVKSEDLA